MPGGLDRAGAELRDLVVVAAIFAVALLVSVVWLHVARPRAEPDGHQRDRFLDGLRGIAAVGVMAAHFGGNVSFALGARDIAPVFHNLGAAGVQVFFALTGFLFTRKAVAARGQLALQPFLVARLRRLVPMYSATIAFAVALVCIVTWREPIAWGGLARQAVSLYAFGFVLDGSPQIKSVPYVDVLGAIWSLPFEWGFYLCVPVLAVLVTSRRMLAVAGAALAVYFANAMTDGRGDVFTPFFLPGVLLGLLPPGRLAIPARARRWLAGAVLLLIAVAVLPGTQSFSPSRLLLMTALFTAVALARPALLAARPVAFLGDISYSVYLMHFPFLFAIKAMLRAFGPAEPLLQAGVFLAACGAVVAASAVTWRFIERPFLSRRAASAAYAPLA